MANLKDISRRIGSVKKTKQITTAMKLVSGARLRKATERALAARPFQQKLDELLSSVLAKAADDVSNPLFERHESTKRIAMVLFTSDRGLCGAFNSSLLRRVTAFLNEKRDAGIEVSLLIFGRKGRDYLSSRGYQSDTVHLDWAKHDVAGLVKQTTEQVVAGFIDASYDEVYLAYNTFVNALVQTPTIDTILPFAAPQKSQEGILTLIEHKYEPSREEVLDTLVPLYLQTMVQQAALETTAGEFAARMTAMDNATRNASDLIDRLTLQFNRARQAAITTEIIEIVSGAQAL